MSESIPRVRSADAEPKGCPLVAVVRNGGSGSSGKTGPILSALRSARKRRGDLPDDNWFCGDRNRDSLLGPESRVNDHPSRASRRLAGSGSGCLKCGTREIPCGLSILVPHGVGWLHRWSGRRTCRRTDVGRIFPYRLPCCKGSPIPYRADGHDRTIDGSTLSATMVY